MEECRMLQEDPATSVEEKRLLEQLVDVVSKSPICSAVETWLAPANPQPTSVIVGRENTALNQCSVNITNIYLCKGTCGQIDEPDLVDVLESIRGTHKTVREGSQEQLPSDGSSEDSGEIASRNSQQENFKGTSEEKEQSNLPARSMVYSEEVRVIGHMTSKELIADYCLYRVRQGKSTAPKYEYVRDEPGNAIAARVREIGTEIEAKYPGVMAGLCDDLKINACTAYSQFQDVANELFGGSKNGEEGVSWGRIAVLITFSGELALYCASHDMDDMVPNVTEWTTRYMNENLRKWIEEHDGWDGFLVAFRKSKEGEGFQDISSLMSSMCKFAAFGAGVAAVGCLMLQR